MQELRYAVRVLRKSPGFTLTAALLVAAGIGANTAVFTALNALLLRPLPVRRPGQLVRLVQTVPRLGTRSNFSYPYYEGLRDQAQAFSAVFAETGTETGLNEPAPAEPVRVHLVTPEYFDALGVPALYGRTLSAAHASQDEGTPPAVLSYGFWRKRFNGERRAIGRTVVLHGHKFVIVGVMPRAFNGTAVDTAPDFRVPVRAFPLLAEEGPGATMQYTSFEVAGRLKPGITRERAQAECQAIYRRSMEAYFKTLPDLGPNYAQAELSRAVALEPLERGVSMLRERFGGALRLLAASAAVLWLLVCANLAGLLLAHEAGRREEMAVRLALGASRLRLARQMLTECSLITALGALGGWLLAYGSLPLLVGALPPMRDLATARLTLALDLAPDRRVLLFSLAIAAATVLLFGAAPALGAARASLERLLRSSRATGSWRGRKALVVFQVALCTLLLAAAGLLVRTFRQLQATDTGFDRAHIATFSADPSLAGYTAAQAEALRVALLARVREMPGVVSVATASRPLLRGSGIKTTVAPTGQRASRADFLNTSINNVSPGYFDTMRVRVLAGRALQAADAASAKPARVVVNEAFARRFFPDGNPVGKRFGHALDSVAGPDFEIVGVAGNAKYRSLREPMTPTFYGLQRETGFFELLVRTRRRPEQVIQPVRQALAALDPGLPFTEVHTLEQEVEASASGERLTATLASVFGGLAALLAAVGIYGLLAFVVAQRQREIGIRMALGAGPGDIGRFIGRQSLAMLGAGVAAGLAASLVAAPAMRSLLYGVPAADPASLAAAAAFVAAVAALATALPVMRAVRTEPASALRAER